MLLHVPFFRYQETYEVVRQVVDENGGEIQYTDVAEFLVKQMLGKFHPTDLLLMQVTFFGFSNCHIAGCYGRLNRKCA